MGGPRGLGWACELGGCVSKHSERRLSERSARCVRGLPEESQKLLAWRGGQGLPIRLSESEVPGVWASEKRPTLRDSSEARDSAEEWWGGGEWGFRRREAGRSLWRRVASSSELRSNVCGSAGVKSYCT